MGQLMIAKVTESPLFPGIHWVIKERVDNDREHGWYLYLFKTLSPGCDGDLYYQDIEVLNCQMREDWGVMPEDWAPYEGPDIR